jgi:hypothetical protein
VRRGYRKGVPFEGFLIEKAIAVAVVSFEKAPASGLSHQKIVVDGLVIVENPPELVAVRAGPVDRQF